MCDCVRLSVCVYVLCFGQCFSHVGFCRQLKAEISGVAQQIPFESFQQVYRKIQDRITKVWTRLRCAPTAVDWLSPLLSTLEIVMCC